ncbi:hypothetical protein ANO11243_062000 [Dothideomycetidae sp. 11243]|nr:hypothetical protein ANO11243_062000 [fungal sp. No.11243]
MGSYLYAIGIVAIVAAAFYKLIVYPVFLSPLSRVPPAHWSCTFCSAWIVWVRWTKQENNRVYDAHMQHGAAVRLSPNLLSINSFDDGVKAIYQGGFPKPDLYFNGFAVYGRQSVHHQGQ